MRRGHQGRRRAGAAPGRAASAGSQGQARRGQNRQVAASRSGFGAWRAGWARRGAAPPGGTTSGESSQGRPPPRRGRGQAIPGERGIAGAAHACGHAAPGRGVGVAALPRAAAAQGPFARRAVTSLASGCWRDIFAGPQSRQTLNG